ncbi:sulfatase-like hydrolase/transferase [Nonomuraea insulae]|uniref:Sulfatase-like hydrolase/transferase n=1 Tax=Nonomuraea insulae TaxID=1616787 RepID=A0ABW1CJ75_9ACTN
MPAILFITADQLRKDALGCYGGRAVATPHLDRIGEEGTVFDRAYTASPVCLPSRSSLLTGRYPRNHGAYSNFRDRALPADVPNLYQVLGAEGYSVGHIGKCHYAPVPYSATSSDRTLPYDSFRDYYLSLGIEHLALQDDKQVSVWFYDDYTRELEAAGLLEAYREAVWDQAARKVFPFPGPAQWHPDAWVGRKAREWIESYDQDRPMFAWVSFSGPHFPFDPPEEYLSRVDESLVGEADVDPSEWAEPGRLHYRSFHGPSRGYAEGGGFHDRDPDYWRQLRRHYLANVALIDDQVGRLIAAAEARFGDDLVVVFTCDHGEMLGNHGFWGKQRCFYEDVLNVPLLLRRPGGAGGGTRTDRLTSLVDVFPTLVGHAGAETVPGIDGRHLDSGGQLHVFAESERFQVVTDGLVKLVHAQADDVVHTEMYDLASDPREIRDVAGSPGYAEAQRDLQAAALRALVDTALP